MKVSESSPKEGKKEPDLTKPKKERPELFNPVNDNKSSEKERAKGSK